MSTNKEITAPAPVKDTINNNKPNTERQNNNSSNNKKINSNEVFQGQGSDSNSFEGADPDTGVVLGLRAERIKKKVPFDVFTEKVSYIESLRVFLGFPLTTYKNYLLLENTALA